MRFLARVWRVELNCRAVLVLGVWDFDVRYCLARLRYVEDGAFILLGRGFPYRVCRGFETYSVLEAVIQPYSCAISVCRKCDNAWQRKICAPHKSISYNHIILSYLILVELEVVYISFNYSLDISK